MVEKKELVEKYEKMYFLEGVANEDKEELSQLYEDFTNFLINIGEENLVWGDCHFEILFIPLTKKLYTEFKETNYVMVYEMFKNWFDNGVKPIQNMRADESYLTLFVEYYKSFKLYLDDKVKKEILEYTIYDDKNVNIAKPKYKLDVLTNTLNFEGKTQNEVKLIIDEIDCLFTHENLHISIFAIGKLNGDVFSVNETDDTFGVLNEHLNNGKTIVLYSAEIKNGKIVYRYSLINKSLDRIEQIKKRNSDNVLFFDKHELESLKKITKTTKVSDYEVLTDDGFVDIEALHETIPYEVYQLKLKNGKKLKCADNHIVFKFNKDDLFVFDEVFVKNLKIGDKILTQYNESGEIDESEVLEITNLGYEEVMYDLELKEGSNRRYYTNGILSHNTLLAKQLAKQMFGSEDNMIRVDMSEYQEKQSISRLIGAPPGYVGYDEGGQLTEQVKNKPYSVILFDEIEKANKDIFSTLLQVLDDGHLTDGMGRKINFKNCVIIMTSNVGVKKLQDFGSGVGFKTGNSSYAEEEYKREVLKKELKKFFTPEFLNRLDEIIIFNSLGKEDVCKIVKLELNKLSKRLVGLKYDITFDETILDLISEVGFDETYGARPIKRAIQDKIEDFVSEEIIKGNMVEGVPYTLISVEKEVVVKPEEVKKSRKKKEDK